MKKLLAMALALVLILGLAAPALAEEVEIRYVEGQLADIISADETTGLQSIADETPEVQEFLRQMYEEGLLQENTDYDLSYFEGEVDEYAAYEAAHPEEIASLDAAKLIAGWRYEDINITAEERFMSSYGYDGETVEEAVKREYIGYRLMVEDTCQEAEEYRAEYPEEWAAFNADAYFEEKFVGEYGCEDKTEYISYWCILTQEEFADDMFVDYIDDDYGWDEPTLTLMVNGVASEAEVTAEKGVSYADADALRAILGDKAVESGATGPVAIRSAAEAAGWDVAWYDGGWWRGYQEIQLWDKAAYETRLAREFGPLNDFLGKVMEQGMGLLFSEEPRSGRETVEVKLTRFSTLDGNKDYTLTLGVDYTAQKGVMDMTLTFDLSQLLQVINARDLAGLLGQGGFDSNRLTQLLKAGKAELILDYNEGVMAYNVPLLAFFDEDMTGWKVIDIDPYGALSDLGELEEFSFVSTLYASMVTRADYMGAEYAAEHFEEIVDLLAIYLGKDCFSTQNGKTTWAIATRGINEALSAVAAEDGGWSDRAYSFFKAFELSYTLDDQGNVSMDMHIRPDMAGIIDAVTDQADYDDYGVATALGWVLPLLDMDITASGSGSQSRYTSRVSVHWNNVGKLEMTGLTTLGKSAKGPRQVADVVPDWADQLQADSLGIIGGIDGPIAILTTV